MEVNLHNWTSVDEKKFPHEADLQDHHIIRGHAVSGRPTIALAKYDLDDRDWKIMEPVAPRIVTHWLTVPPIPRPPDTAICPECYGEAYKTQFARDHGRCKCCRGHGWVSIEMLEANITWFFDHMKGRNARETLERIHVLHRTIRAIRSTQSVLKNGAAVDDDTL